MAINLSGRPIQAHALLPKGHDQAVQAVLIGHAANVSIARGGRPVKVQEFLKRG